jgi:predicted DNA-binding transcriptional regulator AlpA
VTQTSEMVNDLPESPVDGLEPLLKLEQLCAWTGYSLSHVNNCRKRSTDPLPTLGTEARPRFLPSEVLAWMRREYARSTTA